MNFRNLCSVVCLVVVVALTTAVANAAVNVLQVESDFLLDAGYQYAPVDFTGSTTQPFSGITCHALSTTSSSTYSAHATVVSNQLLTAAGLGTVTDIYCLNATRALGDNTSTSFLESYVWSNPSPTALGNDIKVVNHSWAAAYPTTTTNTAAIQRIDYMIHRDDLVMVSGAVTGASPSSPASLVWSSRNGIAVRGATYSTDDYNSFAFHPSDVASGIGKTHADLWGPTINATYLPPSYQTGAVSGCAAALVAAAGTHPDWSSANGSYGLHHEVVKSLLMTGANKTAFDTTIDGGFTEWNRETSNNLDAKSGAGRVVYSTSLAVLNAGPQMMASVSGSTVVSPTIVTTTAGWVYDSSLSGGSSEALIVDLTGKTLTELTATLAWDAPLMSDSTFTNLDLKLVHVTKDGNTYTLSDTVDVTGAVSNTGSASSTTSDNLEHLYFTGATLTDGLYAFVISNIDTASLSSGGYGFSYTMTTVPEPGTLLMFVTGLAVGLAYFGTRKISWAKSRLIG